MRSLARLRRVRRSKAVARKAPESCDGLARAHARVRARTRSSARAQAPSLERPPSHCGRRTRARAQVRMLGSARARSVRSPVRKAGGDRALADGGERGRGPESGCPERAWASRPGTLAPAPARWKLCRPASGRRRGRHRASTSVGSCRRRRRGTHAPEPRRRRMPRGTTPCQDCARTPRERSQARTPTNTARRCSRLARGLQASCKEAAASKHPPRAVGTSKVWGGFPAFDNPALCLVRLCQDTLEALPIGAPRRAATSGRASCLAEVLPHRLFRKHVEEARQPPQPPHGEAPCAEAAAEAPREHR